MNQDWFESWEIVSMDQKEVLLNMVVTDVQPNQPLVNLRLKGLDPNAKYMIDEKTMPEAGRTFEIVGNHKVREEYINKVEVFTGEALMSGGYTFPFIVGDYPAIQIHFKKID